MAVAPASELVPLPTSGRRFVAEQYVRLGDVDPDGVLRLDATARHLQDVANDDAVDSGLTNSFGWVVRRTLIVTVEPAVLGERLQLTTFCSGTGRCWAERRTSLVGDRGGHIEAVSLWIQVDPTSGRPTGLGDDFHRIYDEAAGGRTVSTRLSLPPPTPDVDRRPWVIRRADLDVFDHVNNAVHWALLEEAIEPAGPPTGRHQRVGRAEIEYGAAVGRTDDQPERLVDRTDDALSVWLTVAGEVRVAARIVAPAVERPTD